MRVCAFMFVGAIIGAMVGVAGTIFSFLFRVPLLLPLVAFNICGAGSVYGNKPEDVPDLFLCGIGGNAIIGGLLGYLMALRKAVVDWGHTALAVRRAEGRFSIASTLRHLARLALLLLPIEAGAAGYLIVVRPWESAVERAYRLCVPHVLSEAEVDQLIEDCRWWTPEGDVRMTRLFLNVESDSGGDCLQAVSNAGTELRGDGTSCGR